MTQVLSTTNTLYTLGSATTTRGPHLVVRPDKRILECQLPPPPHWNKVSRAASRTVSVDTLEAQVYYTEITNVTVTDTTSNDLRTPGSPCSPLSSGAPADCFLPDGTVLGGWGTINTEGAANLNGDAYQPFYDTPTSRAAPVCTGSSTSAYYDAENYYYYAVQLTAGSSTASSTSSTRGSARWAPTDRPEPATGDQRDRTAVSSWYEVWDTWTRRDDITDDRSSRRLEPEFTGTLCPTPDGRVRWQRAQRTIPRTATGATTRRVVPTHGAAPPTGAPRRDLRPTSGDDRTTPAAQRNDQRRAGASHGHRRLDPTVYGLGAMQIYNNLHAGAAYQPSTSPGSTCRPCRQDRVIDSSTPVT